MSNYFSTGAELQAALDALPASKTGNSMAFDPFFYGQTYMASYAGDLSPIDHFVQVGAARGYKPNPVFDPIFYRTSSADLNNLDGVDLLYHFVMYGLDEGRAPNADLAGFDGAAYLASNPDVQAVVEGSLDQFGGNLDNGALAHFVKFGMAEGRGVGLDSAALRLTVAQDEINGDAAANTFKAVVAQNSQGAQVNTLGSGDFLDGKGGVDTLNAKVTSGVFAGGSFTMPIQPETQSVEIVKLEAVIADISSTMYGVNNDKVFVNAKDMVDVQQLWSNRSDADLTVMNLTTKGLENLSDMTIGMAYTGNKDSEWGASDYTVYFDQDYLVPQSTRSKPMVDFLAMNEDGYDASNGELPLDGVFFRELQFTLNGTTFDLTDYLGEDPAGTGSEIKTYEDFLAAVQAALVQLKAAHPGNAALQTVQAEFGQIFYTDVDPVTLVQRKGVAVRLTVDGLTGDVENNLSVVSTDLEVARAAGATVPNNNRYEIADATPPEGGSKLGINVALEKVGLAGDGGQLVIGSMNKTTANEWDAVNTVVDGTTSGIEEFYVTVQGDASKSSSLAGLHSTNNNLRVVTVATDAAVTGTKGYANLTIGNSNTAAQLTEALPTLGAAAALKDVQTFDASAFKGDLHLHAALTAEVADKYLNLVDESPALPAADNVPFEYTGGTGNDYFNIALDTSNAAFSGTVTREDFVMNLSVEAGEGNDEIVLGMVDDTNFDNWYLNHQKLNNVRIDGGEGDDTLRTPGSGDVIIDAGTGNDTVYADNMGSKAVWALNTESVVGQSAGQLNDLESDVNDSYRLFKTDVRVSFLGFEAKADIIDRQGIATDLDINQAIKKAINSDLELSKLLKAEDGPANTLIITSLVDGQMELDDLTVELVAPAVADITAGDAAQLAGWYASAGLTPAAAKTLIDAQVANFNTNLDGVYNKGFASLLTGSESTLLTGSESTHVSDNTITGDLGDDVLVLGTGDFSNDTIVYAGFGNGRDSVVNFDTGNRISTTDVSDAGIDYIDFSSYGAVGVLVGAALEAGKVAAAGQKYVLLTESTTNAGEYAAEVYTEAGATDTPVGVVGVLDFGATQDFQAANFIL